MSRLDRIKDFLLSLIYPERCTICDEVIDYNSEGICEDCRKKVKIIDNRCYKCGKQLASETMQYCADCQNRKHKYDRGYSLYVYNDDIKNSIYRFKYANRRRYAKFYGREMAIHLGNEIRNFKPDALIPVPLYRKKLEKRGYNQAALLAEQIGRQLDIPVLEDIIVREKDTQPLKLLRPEERQKNLEKAFKMGNNDVKLNSIVIVDDIYTTGSTINEISGVFRAAGVNKIGFVSLASGSNI